VATRRLHELALAALATAHKPDRRADVVDQHCDLQKIKIFKKNTLGRHLAATNMPCLDDVPLSTLQLNLTLPVILCYPTKVVVLPVGRATRCKKARPLGLQTARRTGGPPLLKHHET
jgi:hypothetical protein